MYALIAYVLDFWTSSVLISTRITCMHDKTPELSRNIQTMAEVKPLADVIYARHRDISNLTGDLTSIICTAINSIVPEEAVFAQKIKGVWLLYVKSDNARVTLLKLGKLTINTDVHLYLYDNNPFDRTRIQNERIVFKDLPVPKNILLTIYNTLILPHINYGLLVWGNQSGKILQLQKKAIRAVSCAGYISHTEPLFKFYDILKVNDIYKYKLLTLYYNMKRLNVPVYLSKFLPDVSHGARNYEIRNPRLQPPVHIHEYITGTCRYQLTVLLNEISSIVEPLDPLKSVVNNVQNVTLLGLKRTIKSYLLQKYSYYCVIPNCYVCQHYVV